MDGVDFTKLRPLEDRLSHIAAEGLCASVMLQIDVYSINSVVNSRVFDAISFELWSEMWHKFEVLRSVMILMIQLDPRRNP